ncbi:MAG TPA: S24/S26 family peptidase [Lacunisphaera sp.]|nr:S24/S26 family peptidase [Lacunisphaera sp.]
MPLPSGCLLLLLLAGAVLQGGEIDQAWMHGIYTGKSPRPVPVSEREAWRRANDLALHTPGAFVLVGGGDSMLPLYTPGTILVMQRWSYGLLQRGQTAIYRNHDGQIVAHVLIAKARDGWRVAGLNNRTHDMEPVLSRNLVGVVIAAFHPVATGPVPRLATLAR